MQTRYFTNLQVANDGSDFAAIATINGRTQMRLRGTPKQAVAALVFAYPELLEPFEVAMSEAEPQLFASKPHIPQPTADDKARMNALTPRELEVVHLLAAEGARNAVIAERLGISVITVRHHLSSIFEKLGVADRFELCHFSYRTGLAKPDWLTAETYARANAAQQDSTSEPALADVP
jgi:DNA-binding CsgD family transcriptional regulator